MINDTAVGWGGMCFNATDRETGAGFSREAEPDWTGGNPEILQARRP